MFFQELTCSSRAATGLDNSNRRPVGAQAATKLKVQSWRADLRSSVVLRTFDRGALVLDTVCAAHQVQSDARRGHATRACEPGPQPQLIIRHEIPTSAVKSVCILDSASSPASAPKSLASNVSILYEPGKLPQSHDRALKKK